MLALLLALTLSDPAHALTLRQMGPYVEAGAGLGLGGVPIRAGVGWEAGVGWWAGRYDDAYAIGRYWSAGLTVRQDWIVGSLRTAPMLEVRRGLDLIVVGWHVFLGGGPMLATVPSAGTTVDGGTARGGAGFEFRRTRYLGLTLRLEGGVDFGGTAGVGGAGAALLGFQFSRPKKTIHHE